MVNNNFAEFGLAVADALARVGNTSMRTEADADGAPCLVVRPLGGPVAPVCWTEMFPSPVGNYLLDCGDVETLRELIIKLWALFDTVDELDRQCQDDDRMFRSLCFEFAQKRHGWLTSDADGELVIRPIERRQPLLSESVVDVLRGAKL